ncbi:MAG: hypothetical protein OXO49_02555 [Gammaproteobacteria bacterium]|nr:hypothetical protein [Gammaproteobacteria bacterium]MDE0251383.1 hypothetical protein [Gammaproteobacteria bacterium]MDE0401933.1 hypothetical protein [Gammaproteobacteria bacterium]
MKIRKLLLGLFAIVVVGSLAYAQGQATSAMGGMQMPSPAEMKQMMEAQKPMMKQETEREMKAWDKNEDGELNKDEFKEMINSQAKDMAEMMAQFSGMPGAPAPELPDIFQKSVDVADDAENETKVAEFDKALTAVFDEYDEDDNDMLSADELTEYGFDQTLAMMGMDDDSDDDDAEAEDADSEE